MGEMSRGTMFMICACWLACGQGSDRPIVFEVASIKPGTQPVQQVTGGMTSYGPPCNGGPGTQDPGRLSCRVTLSRFTSMAFNLKMYQSKFPAWMDTAWFGITAVVPAGATKEDLRVMEQNLLKERFKLATHVEKREMQVYLLSVAKNGPKLKEARDPAAPEDNSPISGPAPLGKPKLDADGFPVLPRGYGSTSVAMRGDSMRIRSAGTTMEQFASFLSTRFDNSVEDATGLQGKYDITVTCSSASVFGITPGPDDGSASAPAGVPTFAEALKQQLGLKLDAMKGLVDVLIIDHVEKVPTEN